MKTASDTVRGCIRSNICWLLCLWWLGLVDCGQAAVAADASTTPLTSPNSPASERIKHFLQDRSPGSLYLEETGPQRFAQTRAPSRAVPPGAARPTSPLASPQGTVVTLTAGTITITNRSAMAGSQTVFPLAADLAVHRLEPVRLVDLKEPAWATVVKEPSRNLSEEVGVLWLKVVREAPQESEPTSGAAGWREQPMPTRISASGVLNVRGTNATLQAEGHMLKLRFTKWSRVYEETPAALSDVRIGAEVTLDFALVDRKFVVRGIDLMPRGSK